MTKHIIGPTTYRKRFARIRQMRADVVALRRRALAIKATWRAARTGSALLDREEATWDRWIARAELRGAERDLAATEAVAGGRMSPRTLERLRRGCR